MRRSVCLLLLLFIGCLFVSGCSEQNPEPKVVKETPGRIPPKK